jgi:hypothetical protein
MLKSATSIMLGANNLKHIAQDRERHSMDNMNRVNKMVMEADRRNNLQLRIQSKATTFVTVSYSPNKLGFYLLIKTQLISRKNPPTMTQTRM